MAKKLQSSLAVEGELPEDGLAAYGDDLMLALARKIVAGDEDADSVESVFAQAQQVAADAEALLVDAGWRAPDPVAVEVIAAVASVNEVLRRGAGAAGALFSWEEFMGGESGGGEALASGRGADALAIRVGAGAGSGGRVGKGRSVDGRDGMSVRDGQSIWFAWATRRAQERDPLRPPPARAEGATATR